MHGVLVRGIRVSRRGRNVTGWSGAHFRYPSLDQSLFCQ